TRPPATPAQALRPPRRPRESRLERLPDPALEIRLRRRPGDVRRHNLALPIDEERLRHAGHAPTAERVAHAVADIRVVDAVPVQVRACGALRVERIHPDEDDALRAPCPRGRRNTAGLLLARDA